MSEENKNDNEKSELESLGAKPMNWLFGMDWACAFLMKTPPVALFVWGAISLVLAGTLGYLSMKTMTAITMNSFQNQVPNNPSQFISSAFSLPAFLLGIVGSLLPIWAVGRLIADAIREGAKK